MFIKDTFKDWDEKCIKVVYFDNLNYIRTFSIEEFKEFFHIKSVSIQKHTGGFLYFENIEYVSPVFGPKFHLDWGLVYGENTPEDPVISVVMEKYGNIFFFMHAKDFKPQGYNFKSAKYYEKLKQGEEEDLRKWEEDGWNRADEYYMDAFDGYE